MMNLLRASMLRCLRLPGRSTALAVLASVAMLGGNASATDPGNVVEDGQFVLGQPADPFSTYEAGQTVGGWKVDIGSVDVCTTYFKVPNDQSNSVDLNGKSPGSISQVLETEKEKTYTIRFLASGNWENDSKDCNLEVQAGGFKRSLSLTRPARWSRNTMGWRLFTYRFKAKSAETTITFRSMMKSGLDGPVIANCFGISSGRSAERTGNDSGSDTTGPQ